MNITSSSFNTTMIQQLQQPQRREPLGSVELANKIIKTSDIDTNNSLSNDELNISELLFSSIDEDGDSSISRIELQNSLSSILDSVKDFKTSPEQFGQLLENMGLEVPKPPQNTPNISKIADGIFNSNDTNKNGTLSIQELGVSEDLFNKTDLNNDGVLSQKEVEEGLTTLFQNVQSGEISKEEAGEVLSKLGVPPPPNGEKPQGSGDKSSSSDEEYDEADTNQDGVVSSAEYEAYYGSNNNMKTYAMDLMSTLTNALKNEQQDKGTQDKLDMSKYKQIMSIVNEQIQDPKTSKMLNTYISNI